MSLGAWEGTLTAKQRCYRQMLTTRRVFLSFIDEFELVDLPARYAVSLGVESVEACSTLG